MASLPRPTFQEFHICGRILLGEFSFFCFEESDNCFVICSHNKTKFSSQMVYSKAYTPPFTREYKSHQDVHHKDKRKSLRYSRYIRPMSLSVFKNVFFQYIRPLLLCPKYSIPTQEKRKNRTGFDIVGI